MQKSPNKKVSVVATVLIFLSGFVWSAFPVSAALVVGPAVPISPSTQGALHPEQICALPAGNVTSSIFYSRTPDIKTQDPGIFVEDENNGNVFWCSEDSTWAPGNVTLIARPPAGAHGSGYYGMGGYDEGNATGNGTGLVLVMTSYFKHGMWFCYFATQQTCALGQSEFIPFPSTYCSTLKTGKCDPYGTALDHDLNVYWVDPRNEVFAECTSASNYTDCFSLPGSSALTGQLPIGLALVNNTSPFMSPSGWAFYVTDNSCEGLVWEGNGTSAFPFTEIARVNDSLQGIGTTTRDVGFAQQLLVGDTGTCHDETAKLVDLTNESQYFPSKFSGPSSVIGISVCSGQCLQNKTGARQFFYTSSNNGTVSISEGRSKN